MAQVAGTGGWGRRIRAGNIGFDMVYTIDLSSVYERVEDAVQQVVEASAHEAERTAYSLAPVRRVVKGDRGGKTRVLSRQERSAEQAVRKQLGLRSGKVIRTAAESRRLTSMPSNPYLRAPGRRPNRSAPPIVKPTSKGGFAITAGVDLNRHGRKELSRGVAITGPTVFGKGGDDEVRRNRQTLRRTNSAIFFKRSTASSITGGLRGGGEYTLGGRLRGEIYSEEAEESGGGRVKWWVISPTYYARYVEFGTRHNKAQPYLRPALAQERRKFADNMRRAIQKLNWKPKRKHVRTRF